MADPEGPPNVEQNTFTPEQEKVLAQEAILRAEKRLRSALLPKDKSVVNVPPAEATPTEPVMEESRQESLLDVTQTIPAGQHWIVEDAVGSTITVLRGAKLTISNALSTRVLVHEGGEANIEDNVKSTIEFVDPDVDTKNLRSGRRAAGRKAQEDTKVRPAPVDQTADATVATATTVDKKEPAIVAGRYQNADGVRYDVRQENGAYYYTPLDGDGVGEELPTTDADEMKELMELYKWKKVDNTLTAVDTTATPDLGALLAVPDATAPAEPKKESMFLPHELVGETAYLDGEGNKKFIKRIGDKYYICDVAGDRTHDTHGFSDVMIKRVIDDNAWVHVEQGTAPADAVVQAPLSRRDQLKAEKKAKEDKALAELHTLLGSETEFVIVNPKTNAETVCQVDDQGIIRKKGEHEDVTDWVIKMRIADTPWEVKVKKTPAPVAPVVPPVPAPAKLPDATLDAGKEKIKLPENPGEKVYFHTPHGQISAEFEPVSGTYLFDFDRTGLSEEDEMAMEWTVALLGNRPQDEIVEQATKEGWQQIDAPVTTSKTSDVVTSPDANVDKSKEQNYSELFQGDVWVLRDASGKFVRAIQISVIFQVPDADKMANVWDVDENLEQVYTRDFGDKKDNDFDVPVANDYPLEDLRRELEEKGYVREHAGSQSEKTVSADPAAPDTVPPTVVSGIDKPRFISLPVGEEAVYSGSLGRVTLRRLMDGQYALMNEAGEVDGPYDEDHIRNIATEEEWVFVPFYIRTPAAMPPIPGSSKMEGFKSLSDGGREHYYVRGTNEAILVEREGDEYMVSRGGNIIPYSEQDLMNLAQAEKWEFFAEGLRPEDFEKKPLEPIEAKEMSEIEKLELIVGEARLRFVTTDHKQSSLMTKLKRLFPGLSETEGVDMKTAREDYDRALNQLREAQLAEIKTGKWEGAALRERMGQMLNYFKYEERVQLAKARDQQKMEETEKKLADAKGGMEQGALKLQAAWNSLGQWYNKQPLWAKLAVGGAVLGGGVAASFGVIGTGAAAVVGGAAFVRRIVTTAGASIALDALSQKGVAWARQRGVNKDTEKELGALDETLSLEEKINKLNQSLEKTIATTAEKYKKDYGQDFLRKGAVRVATVAGLAWAATSFIGHETSISDNKLGRNIENSPPAGAASVGERAASAASGVGGGAGSAASFNNVASSPYVEPGTPLEQSGIANIRPEHIVPLNSIESAAPAPEAGLTPQKIEIPKGTFLGNPTLDIPVDGINQPHLNVPTLGETLAPTSETVRNLLQSHDVTSADGKRGLWGVLSDRLPKDLVKTPEGNRIVASIENLMRKDLAAMSPAERAAAGFAEGKLDLIHKGDVVQFDKFPSLTPEKIQAILDGKSVGAPSIVAEATHSAQAIVPDAPEMAGGIPVSPMDHALNEQAMSQWANQPMTALDTTEANDVDSPARIHPSTDPKKFIAEFPQSRELLSSTTARLQRDLLMLMPGDEPVPSQYDYATNGEKLGKTRMFQVLKDFGSMRPRDISVNPLHPDQERALANLYHNATKAFGPDVAKPKLGETATSYIERMTTAALRQGVDVNKALVQPRDFHTEASAVLNHLSLKTEAPSSMPPVLDTKAAAVTDGVAAKPATLPPIASVPNPMEFANPVRLNEYLVGHPELAPSYQDTLTGMKEDIFGVPEMRPGKVYMAYESNMTYDMGRANMARVLETARDFRTGVSSEVGYDKKGMPFHSTQIQRLVHLSKVASHPRIFGELGLVRSGESVKQYMERVAALTTALHKERELSYLLKK